MINVAKNSPINVSPRLNYIFYKSFLNQLKRNIDLLELVQTVVLNKNKI